MWPFLVGQEEGSAPVSRGLPLMSDTKCQSLALPEIAGSEGAFSAPVLKLQIQVEILGSFIEPTHLCQLHSIK